jgi:hypothetical protein
MGLDTSAGWHSPYSAFNRFREGIAMLTGYSAIFNRTEQLAGPFYDTEILQGDWPEPPHDALLYLLIHSDCDGCIRSANCKPLAIRLQQIRSSLAALPDDPYFGDWQAAVDEWINGLHDAAEKGEDVEFN